MEKAVTSANYNRRVVVNVFSSCFWCIFGGNGSRNGICQQQPQPKRPSLGPQI
uniref:Uncharacterized protein n=1 Tax=Meloidogyne incognita TaxID=6306 RepID=A0A914LLV7_MELIC